MKKNSSNLSLETDAQEAIKSVVIKSCRCENIQKRKWYDLSCADQCLKIFRRNHLGFISLTEDEEFTQCLSDTFRNTCLGPGARRGTLNVLVFAEHP